MGRVLCRKYDCYHNDGGSCFVPAGPEINSDCVCEDYSKDENYAGEE